MEIAYKQNLGTWDRLLRVVGAGILVGVAEFRSFPVNSFWPGVLVGLGIITLAEAAAGY